MFSDSNANCLIIVLLPLFYELLSHGLCFSDYKASLLISALGSVSYIYRICMFTDHYNYNYLYHCNYNN